MISRLTSNVPKEDVVFPRLLYSDSRCSQACRWRSQVLPGFLSALPDLSSALPDLSSALPDLLSALPGLSPAIPGAPNVLSGAPRCSQTYHNHSHGTPVAVIRDPSYSEGRPECPPRVWYFPEIDPFKFTLHIISDTPGGFQRLKYILLMHDTSEGDGLLLDNCLRNNYLKGSKYRLAYQLHSGMAHSQMEGRGITKLPYNQFSS